MIPKIEMTHGPNAMLTEREQFVNRWWYGNAEPWDILLALATTVNAIADHLNAKENSNVG